jgi:hypothetical protein
VVAGMFMSVFELSILTVLHCYIADTEMFGGRARYADGSLKEWIESSGKNDSNGGGSGDGHSSVVVSSYKRKSMETTRPSH